MLKTINGKIVLWYAVSVVCLLVIFTGILFTTQRQMTGNLIENRLRNAIHLIRVNTQYNDYALYGIDDAEEQGIQVLVYDAEGNLIEGSEPDLFQNLPLTDEGYEILTSNGLNYYVYDEILDSETPVTYWIRTYFIFDNMMIRDITFSKTSIRLIPFIVVLAVILGFFMAKRMLAPIQQIRLTADEITQSGDLHRRITLKKSFSKKKEDELTRLADTFNEMFDRIENLFEQEKQLTSDAAHELRNPVSVILAQAEYLDTQVQQLQKEQARIRETAKKTKGIEEEGAGITEETTGIAEIAETAEVILRQAKRMQKLVNDLLMIARLENQSFTVRTEDVDFSELTETVAEEMQDTARQRHIDIRTEIPQGILIRSNEALLIRVLMNLIDNAVKYGRDGGWIRVTVSEQADRILCSVEDNGIGIAPDDLDRIWNRFYTVDPTGLNMEESTGLGLFLVRRITTHLGGTITAESTPGEGSCFTLSLPAGRK